MFNRLHFWKEKGMNPSIIYDIGANEGEWTRNMRHIFPTARYEEFEANEQHKRNNCHTVLLGDTEKESKFYKQKSGPNTGASMYIEVTQHFTPGNFITETLPVIPLDTYVAKQNIALPDFIKLDVQGAELEVLDGAKKCLTNAKYILMEVSLHRWNQHAPMIEDVIVYMKRFDFEMIDIVDTHHIDNYMFQVDALFAHKSTNLRRQSFY